MAAPENNHPRGHTVAFRQFMRNGQEFREYIDLSTRPAHRQTDVWLPMGSNWASWARSPLSSRSDRRYRAQARGVSGCLEQVLAGDRAA